MAQSVVSDFSAHWRVFFFFFFYKFLSDVGAASEVTVPYKPHDVRDPWCGNPVGNAVSDCAHTKPLVGLFGPDNQF